MDDFEIQKGNWDENDDFLPNDTVTEEDFVTIETEETEKPVEMPDSPFADSPYITAFESGTATVPRRKKKQGSKTGLLFVLATLLIVGCCGITASLVNLHWQREMDNLSTAMLNKINSLQNQIFKGNEDGTIVIDGQSPAGVYAKNYMSVVAVTGKINMGNTGVGVSSGSGFVISQDGYVATNYHVVEGSEKVQVQTADGKTYTAVVVGSDVTNDVALLKVDAKDLVPVTLGSSADVVVGQQVVAIGNALGEYSSTLTVGYVSAKDRVIATDGTTINMLQTDAAINSGNSGGPLLDMNGNVIGIITAKISGTSSSGASIEGIGFAIPIDDVAGMLQDLKDYGYVTGAYLGVIVKNVPEEVQAFGLPAGAYIDEISPGFAAEKAGLQVEDIIIGLNETKITSINDLTRALRNYKAGDSIEITVYRSGQEVKIPIILDEKPHD